jgi:hypothetical protein
MKYLGSAPGRAPAKHGPRERVPFVSFVDSIRIAKLDGRSNREHSARLIAFAPPSATL